MTMKMVCGSVCGYFLSYKGEMIKSLDYLLALIFTAQAPGMYLYGPYLFWGFFRGFGNLSSVTPA